MATVNKNFRIKHGLVVEGSSGTIDGHNILTESTSGNQYILNLVGGATLVKSVDTDVFNVDGSGNLTINAETFDSYGSAAAAQAAAEATASADATTKANAAQAAAEATASADATTKANAAQAAAEATASADATTKANAAQAAAEATASADATTKANAAQAAAEATAQAALDDVLDSSTPFESMNINDVAKQVAARTTSLGSVVVTAYQFNKSAFKSGKFLVKIDNGTHNEISEILVTLDSGDNVAITEYAIVGTNGTRGTITADIENSHCRIRVNPVNDSTITVFGTIFNS
jgi:chemotaxis protein histidine kinase CheA